MVDQDLKVSLTDDTLFSYIIRCFLVNRSIEINGVGRINPETEELVSFVLDTSPISNSSGGVQHHTAPQVIAHLTQFGTVPNLQVHTHPGMGVFWSPTDLNAQNDEMKDLLVAQESGVFYWMVIDQLDWKVTKAEWANRTPTRLSNGHVVLQDTPLVFKRSYKSYGDEYDYGYYGGGYIVGGKNEKKEKEVNESDFLQEDSYYDELFEAYEVEKYAWGKLVKAVEADNPGDKTWYSYVLTNPHTWNYLGKNIEEFEKEVNRGL